MADNNDEIIRAIGRLEGKMDSIIIDIKQHNDRANNHGQRIATLEKRQYGVFLVGGIVFTALMTAVKKFF